VEVGFTEGRDNIEYFSWKCNLVADRFSRLVDDGRSSTLPLVLRMMRVAGLLWGTTCTEVQRASQVSLWELQRVNTMELSPEWRVKLAEVHNSVIRYHRRKCTTDFVEKKQVQWEELIHTSDSSCGSVVTASKYRRVTVLVGSFIASSERTMITSVMVCLCPADDNEVRKAWRTVGWLHQDNSNRLRSMDYQHTTFLAGLTINAGWICYV
jgi:hypothetical protein